MTHRLAATLCTLSVAVCQQIPDPAFRATVKNPAYTERHPQVLFDQAHHNFHTAAGRYKPFADLLRNDGYKVIPNLARFTADSFQPLDVLVIANALGAEAGSGQDTSRPAFTKAECEAVSEWIDRGGALLLIADHAPFGAAAEILANRIGVDMGKGFVLDPHHSLPDDLSILAFRRRDGLLGDHPITRGRNAKERLNTVYTFTGQSLQGPPGSVALLKLADTAVERPGETEAGEHPARGRNQGLAFHKGKGKVVVLGEAALLSAQIVTLDGPDGKKQTYAMGMNYRGSDDRQFALNIMHWLSGLSPD